MTLVNFNKFNKLLLLSVLLVLSALMTSCFEQKTSSLKKSTGLPNLAQNGSDDSSHGSLNMDDDSVKLKNIKTKVVSIENGDFLQNIYVESFDTKRPVFIFLHGGEWNGGSIEDHAFISTLTDIDYGSMAVVKPSYRSTLPENGSLTGVLPLAFESQESSNKYPMQVQDVDCALRWVAANATEFNFDLDKVYLGGISSGAQLALLIGLTKEDTYKNTKCPFAKTKLPNIKKIVSIAGQTDLKNYEVVNDGIMLDLNSFKEAFVGHEAIAEVASPIKYVTSDNTNAMTKEFLLIYSKADKIVPYTTQFDPFYQKLQDSKFKVATMIFNNADHYFSYPEDIDYSSYILSSMKAFFLNEPIIENVKVTNDNGSISLRISGINFSSTLKAGIRLTLQTEKEATTFSIKYIDQSNVELVIDNNIKTLLASSEKFYLTLTDNKNKDAKESNIKIISTQFLKTSESSEDAEYNITDSELAALAGIDEEQANDSTVNGSLESSTRTKELDRKFVTTNSKVVSVKVYTQDTLINVANKAKTSAGAKSTTCKDWEEIVDGKCQVKCIGPIPENSIKCVVDNAALSNWQYRYGGSRWLIKECPVIKDDAKKAEHACHYACKDGYTPFERKCVAISSFKMNVQVKSHKDCPDNYVYIKPNKDVGTTRPFCVMRYLATKNNNSVSTDLQMPIWRPYAQEKVVFSKCSELGKNYALMSNAEWMTIARDVESVDENWSGGKKGLGQLFSTIKDSWLISYNSKTYIKNLNNPFENIYMSKGAALPMSSASESTGSFKKRVMKLSSGEYLWDLSGVQHVVDWSTTDTILTPPNPAVDCGFSFSEAASFDMKAIPSPAEYASANGYGVKEGAGSLRIGCYKNIKVATRGLSGLFALDMSGYVYLGAAFRCVYRLP